MTVRRGLAGGLGRHHVPPQGAVEGGEGGAHQVEAGGEVADAGRERRRAVFIADGSFQPQATILSTSASAPAAVTSPPAP